MIKKLLNFINQQTLFGEIMRFVLVGGLATVIDFFVMGLTLYLLDSSIYPHFYNVFFGGGTPTNLNSAIGTGMGFLFGLAANYLLSIIFVFNEKGKSKTVKGAIKFTIFSVIGLIIHEVGMLVLFGKLKINEWIVKIAMTIVVLIYNYLTRKIFIFKNGNNSSEPNLEGENQ